MWLLLQIFWYFFGPEILAVAVKVAAKLLVLLAVWVSLYITPPAPQYGEYCSVYPERVECRVEE